MSKNRLKLTQTLLRNRLEAEHCAGEIADLKAQEAKALAEMDIAVTAIRESFERRLAALRKGIGEKSQVLQVWAEANPSEFAGRKSLDLTHAVIGWRTGQPALKTLAGWTWDRVLEKLKSAARNACFIRTKQEVDKQVLLAARVDLKPEELREMGVRVIQEESFFIEPKLTESETRVVAEAQSSQAAA